MHTAPGETSATSAIKGTPGDPRQGPGDPRQGPGDPRLGWSATATTAAPLLRHRRDGILPAIAAALSVRGETLTCTAGKGEQPPILHTLVQDYLDTLTSGQRERFTGRCPEAILLSRHLTAVETGRSKRAQRKPLTHGEARRALKHAKLTARRIREDGDPLHGSYAPPCRSCTALLDHFGVRSVEP
ncbi:YwqJ-related putative deaminase [Streptomyces sp. NBC_00212]|uniref:YwqJ-related putative deaminase n=1 Tax=Streptomyces sp. NBC_00212 TaxID=2975684 RepID=UPI003247566C